VNAAEQQIDIAAEGKNLRSAKFLQKPISTAPAGSAAVKLAAAAAESIAAPRHGVSYQGSDAGSNGTFVAI
jgi:hypothetical protein